MIEVQLVKEGVSDTSAFEGKFFKEYGFSKDDMKAFHEKYEAAINKEFANIEHVRHLNSAKYSMLADAIHKKVSVDTFVPKINKGIITHLKTVIRGQGHEIAGVIKKNNGNVQIILGTELKGPTIDKTVKVAEEQGEEVPTCPD